MWPSHLYHVSTILFEDCEVSSTNGKTEIVDAPPVRTRSNNKQSRDVWSHAREWKGTEEDKAIRSEPVADGNELAQDVIKGDLASGSKPETNGGAY